MIYENARWRDENDTDQHDGCVEMDEFLSLCINKILNNKDHERDGTEFILQNYIEHISFCNSCNIMQTITDSFMFFNYILNLTM